jgi:hypothetical protein
MKYSDIIGEFFNIGLSSLDSELVDAHYLGSAHHRYRYLQSKSRFHSHLFTLHLEALFKIISKGDFSKASDKTGEGLADPQAWAPPPRLMLSLSAKGDLAAALRCLPDEGLFTDFPADRRYGPNESFPYDRALVNPNNVFELSDEMLKAA